MNKLQIQLDKLIQWKYLYQLSNIPFIKQTYLYIVLVPIIASFVQLNLGLEFLEKWRLLYFIALFFLMARILVIINCPEIVSIDKDYPTFKKFGYGSTRLNEYLEIFLCQKYRDLKNKILTADTEFFYTEFQAVYNIFNFTKYFTRLIISILYLLGFIGIIYILFNYTNLVINTQSKKLIKIQKDQKINIYTLSFNSSGIIFTFKEDKPHLNSTNL